MSFGNYPPSRNDPDDAQRAQDGKPTTHPVFQWDWENPSDFTSEQRAAIGRGINSMNALGATNVWDSRLPNVQKVLVRRWPDDNSTRPGPAVVGNAGITHFRSDGSIEVWFDTSGLHGEDAVFRAAQHEAGHVMMGPGLPNDGHVPAGPRTVAVMNPTIPEAQFNDLPIGSQPMENTMTQAGGLLGPTQSDFDLYDKAMITYATRIRAIRHQ